MRDTYGELKAGIVVLLASVALLFLLFLVTGGRLFKSFVQVHLEVAPGGLAPSKGDSIYLNGFPIGTAETVELRVAQRRRGDVEVPEIYVHVLAEIEDTKVRLLPADTYGQISESLTGQLALQLIPGTSSTILDPAATEASPIQVRQVPGFARLADQIDRVAEDLQETLAVARKDLDRATDSLTRTLDRAHDTIAGFDEQVIGSGRLEQSLVNVEAATLSLRNSVAAIEKRVDRVTETVEATVGDFRKIAATGVRITDGLETKLAGILDEVRGITTKLDAVVAKAGPKVDGLLDDARAVGRNLVQVSEDLARSGPTVRGMIESAGHDMDVLLETLIEVGQNLADASEDIRAHPWKLLNEPEKDEIAFENLRNAMQNYVRAGQRMERTAVTVRDLWSRADEDPVAGERLLRALDQLDASVERYKFFEQRLMELLQANQLPVGQRRNAPPPRPCGDTDAEA